MQLSASYLLAIVTVFAACAANAQTVRFTTNIGAFDMVLNPTGDANLQPLVDNLLANVAAGVYHDTWVNRADPGFVLQLGGFTVDSVDPDDIGRAFDSANSFDPVSVDNNGDGNVDFAAQSNSRGTVSLALSAGNPNSGSSSFFVNVGDNAGLDTQGFVPFAFVDDLTVVDQIMAAPRIDVGPQLGQAPGGIAFSNAPIANGDLIIIESAGVVSSDPVSFVNPLLSAVGSIDDTAASLSSSDESPSDIDLEEELANLLSASEDAPLSATTDFGFFESDPVSAVNAVPEPGSIALALLALGGACRRR